MTDLGALGDMEDSFAADINDLGQIVGRSWFADFSARHAFLYGDGAMTDLHSLIDPQSGCTITDATASTI